MPLATQVAREVVPSGTDNVALQIKKKIFFSFLKRKSWKWRKSNEIKDGQH